jgi:hypothetical protein
MVAFFGAENSKIRCRNRDGGEVDRGFQDGGEANFENSRSNGV